MKKIFIKIISMMEKNIVILCVKRGLVMTIPVLIIGAMSLVLKTLPIQPYQDFIENCANGFLLKVVTFVYDATFGMLSIYITLNISISFAQKYVDKVNYAYAIPIAALAAFAILIGVTSEDSSYVKYFGVTGMFCAIFSSVTASHLYVLFGGKDRKLFNAYTEGADTLFNNIMGTIFPFTMIVSIIAVFNYIICVVFKVNGFQELFIMLTNSLFYGMGRSLFSELLFVFISSLLWFFGIHGSNVLENVTQSIFVPGVEINAANIANGLPATEIVSKTFFDTFVVMGGCGTALCLLLTILLVSKVKNTRSLAKISIVPLIFNINEQMIFGLPVIFNPVLFIPFILTPLVCTVTSYFAMYTGIVPMCSSLVEWTTPVFMSGYISTGSIRGSILQLINLILGVLIYMPFIKIFDNQKISGMKDNVTKLKDILIENENKGDINLVGRNDNLGDVAKMLVEDLKYAISHSELNMYYQPQYNSKNECIGAEALLRWNHPVCGMIYPPLIIKLADESKILPELENHIFNMVAEDIKSNFYPINKDLKICVNVSASILQSEGFEALLTNIVTKYNINPKNICLEVTEQMTLNFNKNLEEKIDRIKSMGFSMAIDDFSMGHTSIEYLKSSYFDMVKLDGSLVKAMNDNSRCNDIIESIVKLGQSLGFDVLAEFVETADQCEKLKNIGCYKYQGYLYSPAVPIDKFISNLMKKSEAIN